jgi:hypothetical protein
MTFVNSATTTAAAVELHHLLGLYPSSSAMRTWGSTHKVDHGWRAPVDPLFLIFFGG